MKLERHFRSVGAFGKQGWLVDIPLLANPDEVLGDLAEGVGGRLLSDRYIPGVDAGIGANAQVLAVNLDVARVAWVNLVEEVDCHRADGIESNHRFEVGSRVSGCPALVEELPGRKTEALASRAVEVRVPEDDLAQAFVLRRPGIERLEGVGNDCLVIPRHEADCEVE